MSTPGWERLKANKRRVNAKSATQSIPSDHASQAAVRRLIPPTPRPRCSLAPSVTTPLYSTPASKVFREHLYEEHILEIPIERVRENVVAQLRDFDGYAPNRRRSGSR